MPKKLEKIEELKIRLSTEEKAYLKSVAKAQGISMSKFVLDLVIPTAKRQLEALESKEIIEDRIEGTEAKIENLKGKLAQRRIPRKKNMFETIFARKS